MKKYALLVLLLASSGFARETTYRFGGGCFGGELCSRYSYVEARLSESEFINEVSFFAHDRIGSKHEGKVNVTVDGQTVVFAIDIKKDGSYHRISINRMGRVVRLVAATNDEVEVRDLNVIVESRRSRTIRYDGRCIGGDICGSHSRLELDLRGRYVESIEFYAHDAIGNKNEGKLNIYADGQMIAMYVDIRKAGALHTFNVNRYVDYLEFQPATDDEVDIQYVNVNFGR